MTDVVATAPRSEDRARSGSGARSTRSVTQPGGRSRTAGTTEIETKAIVSTVRGVVRECVAGHRLATHDVSVDRDGHRVQLRVRAAVPYPRSIRRTGAELQRALTDRVPALTGEDVDGVDVVCVPEVRTQAPRISTWPGWGSALRRLVAAVVAVALTAGAVVVAADLVAARFGDGPVVADWGSWLDSARDTAWDEAAVLAFGFGAIAVGIVVLMLALLPSRHRRTVDVAAGEDAAVEWRVSAGDLGAELARVAERETGGTGTRATVSGRRVRLRMKTARRDTDAVRDRVTEAVGDRYVELTHHERPKVRVDVRGTR